MKTVRLLLCLAVALSAGLALACMNGLEEERRVPDTLLAQARRAFKAGRFTEAASKSALALSAPGSDAEQRALWRLHGLSCLKIGNLPRAVESLTSLSQHTKEPLIHVKLAEARVRLAAREDRAEPAAKDALEGFASREQLTDADAWTALALARRQAGEPDLARRACQTALGLQPRHEEASTLLTALPALQVLATKTRVKR
ncbi:MAG: hypothetical protein JNJ54_14620 [Myxococcaceae bacterium]|nr:hypothetical protein [Myxococcaceae bacterium]